VETEDESEDSSSVSSSDEPMGENLGGSGDDDLFIPEEEPVGKWCTV
jgi:hypothetical protein